MRKVICFHNPDEMNGYLSNWYMSEFVWNEQEFTSMEQYMMYRKAILFEDTEVAQEIMKTNNVGKIKALGRTVRNYNDVIWNGVRQIVVYEGLLEKFRQNDKLKERLLATQEHILAECAVQDRIWGVGLSMKDDRRFDLAQWQGKNLLGFSLMQVRNAIQKGSTKSNL